MKKVLTITMKSAKLLTMKISSTNPERSQYSGRVIITASYVASVELQPAYSYQPYDEMLPKIAEHIPGDFNGIVRFNIIAASSYDYQDAIASLVASIDKLIPPVGPQPAAE